MRLLNKEEEIFRLAAVLYKDGNYEVSKENTLKKIVKAIFLENDNISKTISEIISAIFENYTLNFSEDEIELVIEKNSKIFQITKPQPTKYNLIEKDYIKLKNKIEKIVYISCNPATFARDVKILAENGYVLKKVTPVDMFPQTPHIEVVGLLENDDV